MADDVELLRAARNGDREALATIFDRFAPALYKYALRLCRDTAEAEDVVGDVLSQLLDHLKAGQGPRENLRAYLYQIAYHKVVDDARQRSKSGPLVETLPSDPVHGPPPQLEGREQLRALEGALQRHLNDEQRHILALRFIENFSLEETADITGKTVGNVKVIQSRAVAILRRVMSDQFRDTP
jgi:RNA polymerase sigma-70 factor, ECF subfamily